MTTAAPDFKIFWDNAYAFHHLTEDEAKSADILAAGVGRRAPAPADHVRLDLEDHLRRRGCGVPAGVGRERAVVLGHLGKGSIGPDKVNQLRHVAVLRRRRRACATTWRHRQIIAPKFDEVHGVLHEELGGLGIATWT